MRAQTLSICVPNKGCDKDCPYCISKMTGYANVKYQTIYRNVLKVKSIAETSQVSGIIFTGKGEPLLNEKDLFYFLEKFSNFPCELQTNGIKLSKNAELLKKLYDKGLDILAISIDDFDQFQQFNELFSNAIKHSLTIRATVNLTNSLLGKYTFIDFIEVCKKYEILQLSFRTITIPNSGVVETAEARKSVTWIKENVDKSLESVFLNKMYDDLKNSQESRVLRTLPYGATLYDYKGISVTHFDYCIQDSHGELDVRSIIFQEDGHLYSTWNSKAGLIF
jgi:organic radical activating enzyme